MGSLFSGIGGLDLGLERAGMRVVWQSEIDPYACAVLKKHWPAVPNLGDVRRVKWKASHRVDVICGGFPCQDISVAGKGAGINGSQSGLWWEFYRAICALRPSYAIVENVPALLSRGLDVVLGDLANGGYDAEWGCISASAVGAIQERERIFIVAYPAGIGVERRRSSRKPQPQNTIAQALPRRHGTGVRTEHWRVEPGVVRMVYGVPNRLDRIKALGNSVVPQVAEVIGRAVMQREA